MDFLIGGKSSVSLYPSKDKVGEFKVYVGGDESFITGTLAELAIWFAAFAQDLASRSDKRETMRCCHEPHG